MSSFTASDLNTLNSLKISNDPIAYYDFLHSKGDNYALLAKGVVNGDTAAGATARTFASNVAQITGVHPQGLNDNNFKALSRRLMENDFEVRKDLFEDGQSPLNLEYDDIRDYHSNAFSQVLNLPPEAWTVFAPFEYSSLSAAQKQTSWESLLADSGDLTGEFMQSGGMFSVTLTSSYSNLANNPNATAAQIGHALWTESMLVGPDRTQFGGGAASSWFEANGVTDYFVDLLNSTDGNIVIRIQIDIPFTDYVIGNGGEPGGGSGGDDITVTIEYPDNSVLEALDILIYSDPGTIPLGVGIHPDGSQYLKLYHRDGSITTKTGTYDSNGDITLLSTEKTYGKEDGSTFTLTERHDEFDAGGTPTDEAEFELNAPALDYTAELIGTTFGSHTGRLLAGDSALQAVNDNEQMIEEKWYA